MKKVPLDLGKVSELIIKGIECWVEAGEIVAAALELDPNSMDSICEKTGLSEDIVRRFEQIGRKEIYPNLLACTGTPFVKLSTCSYREQKKYCDNPIPLLLVDDSGSTDTLMVSTQNLTPDQCKQAFARNHVRTLEEQRAFMESERKKSIDKAIKEKACVQDAAFVIRGKRVIFRAGCEMTVHEVAELLARMS